MRSILGLLVFFCFLINGCAVLHRVQLSDLEKSEGAPFSVRVSETTVDFGEIGNVAKSAGRMSGSRDLSRGGQGIELYTAAFQFGPRTGTPVFNEFYARDIPERVASQCKNGRVANLISVRETRSYPIVKGEIVRVDGVCVKR